MNLQLVLNGDDVIVAVEGRGSITGVRVFYLIPGFVVRDASLTISERQIAGRIQPIPSGFSHKEAKKVKRISRTPF